MPPWSGEVPPGYIDPSLLFLGADGQVYLRTQEGPHPSEADHSSSHESVSSSNTDNNSSNEHRTHRVNQLHDAAQAFDWNMDAVFAYDAQIRAEQALRHQRTIEIARQIYAARIGHIPHPEDSYHNTPAETRVIPWPASERSLTDVIELLQFEKSITRVGCQRWEVIRAWLGWAVASKEKRHTIQLDQIRNVYRFMDQGMDENDRADQIDTDGIEDFKMEVDGSEVEESYPTETDGVIIGQPDLGR
ncbi:uncharacterized protein H6S33_006527 [Morchella sextelata]|uniref:uncharacterized protein n=1 Tax=Morchella sextelata TaxID=1174677 RepID=UPI001D04BE54|nr:uncharacterized protein H6S33_006527 [Morchella sextelata]KAH0604859.1 hypothetical protein H6S33_006527 [Morchella sextelata]